MNLLMDGKSHFSVGESLLEAKGIAELAKLNGYDAAALCDTMTISGMPDFTRACQDQGIKPIIGARLRVVESLDRVKKQGTTYPKLFALTERGLEIIMALLTIANDDDHFYHTARLSWDDVYAALDDAAGHVAFATGTLYSALRERQCVEILRKIGSLLSASHTLVEITPADSPVWDRQAYVGYKIANELDLPVVLSRPALYSESREAEYLSFLGAICSNRKVDGLGNYRGYLRDYVVQSPKALVLQALEQVKRIKKRIDPDLDASKARFLLNAWQNFGDAVEYTWSKRDISLPKMAEDENAELKRLASEGLRRRFATDVFGFRPSSSEAAVYVERLKYELGVLTDMGFAGYFLLTREIVNWSKDAGIAVGPGRGSVGGSLVAYALGITDVDPIRFDLIFERFINPERLDLPDADLDFMSTRRSEVIRHIEETYGTDRVASISNYTMLHSRSAIADITRVLDMPMQDRVSKLIPEEQGTAISLARAREEVGAVASFADRHPAVWRLAEALEGKHRSLGRHAAGVVVAGCPLIERAVVEKRSGERTVNWDKRVVEDMGLVKLDILGLSNLDLLRLVEDYIEKRHGKRPNLGAIPLDDEKVMQAFAKGDTVGIFQFESGGMRRLLKDLAVGGALTFEDITATTALYRPGPMESGLMADFVGIRQGMMSEYYEHPSMKAALEPTYSVIVYQEQVMRISTDLCGFTLAEADHLRKAMGKKDKVKMAKLLDQFVDGAVSAGMEPSKAKELWDKIEKFAGYGFNRSHAVAYTLISYQTMYAKVHYPVEFYAAALSILKEEKRPGIIADAKRRDISVLPPDINASSDVFEILNDKTLVAPFSVVKQVSAKAAAELVSKRAAGGRFTSIKDVEERCTARLVNSRVRENLDLVGAFARVEPGQRLASDPRRRPDQLELCGSIILGGATVTRDLHVDRDTIAVLKEKLSEAQDTIADAADKVFVTPKVGSKTARFMAVVDGPGWSEEQGGQFTKGKSFDYISLALGEAGLQIQDGYWTGMTKLPKPKGQRLYPAAQLSAFEPLFRQEMDLLRPQVIVVLGTNALRFFQPKLKGGIMDHAGKIIYSPATDDKENDFNLVIGINPAMIAFDEAKQEVLNDVFRTVAEMIL